MHPIVSMVAAATRHFPVRLLKFFVVVVAGLAAVGLPAPALAVDLTGKTIRFEGFVDRSGSTTTRDFNYIFEIYFGSKGNRFVKMTFTQRTNIALIPAGTNRGIHRTADMNFVTRVTLQQTPSTLNVHIAGSGADFGFASETWVFDIALAEGRCQVQDFRYTPDPSQRYRTTSVEGACTITNGPSAGITGE